MKTETGQVIYHQDISQELEDVFESKLVGRNLAEAEQQLLDRHGVRLMNTSGVADDVIHKEISGLMNMAEHNQTIGGTLTKNCEVVNYRPHKMIGDTANMEWVVETNSISVYPGAIGGDAPASWVHELGHSAHDAWLDTKQLFDNFDKGIRASSYGHTNAFEDFAETFVARVDGRWSGIAEAAPDKVRIVDEAIRRGLG